MVEIILMDWMTSASILGSMRQGAVLYSFDDLTLIHGSNTSRITTKQVLFLEFGCWVGCATTSWDAQWQYTGSTTSPIYLALASDDLGCNPSTADGWQIDDNVGRLSSHSLDGSLQVSLSVSSAINSHVPNLS